jgi:hypothetical protein
MKRKGSDSDLAVDHRENKRVKVNNFKSIIFILTVPIRIISGA